MKIDWAIVIAVISPLLPVVVAELLRRRPKLVWWTMHSSAVNIETEGKILPFHTHSVAVQNIGRKTAHNVRLGHNYLPASFSLYPAVQHTTHPAKGAPNAEIILPTLVPGEQVMITYLYFPPLTWNQVNTYVKSDEGFARAIPMTTVRQYARWVYRLLAYLMFMGSAVTIYLLIELARIVWPQFLK